MFGAKQECASFTFDHRPLNPAILLAFRALYRGVHLYNSLKAYKMAGFNGLWFDPILFMCLVRFGLASVELLSCVLFL